MNFSGQVIQFVILSLLLYVSEIQEHIVFSALFSERVGQSEQAKLDSFGAIFPTGQNLHSMAPINSEYFPSIHSEHLYAPIDDILPVGQGLQSFTLLEPLLGLY